MAIERASEFGDFQAEYEGSIPFTRSDFVRYSTMLCDLGTLLNAAISLRYRQSSIN
jgi:hypothetical protein